jgi:hypothetical protein
VLFSDVALLTVIVLDNKLGSSPIIPLPSFICSRTTNEARRKKWERLRAALIEYILCAADNLAVLGSALLISAYLDTFVHSGGNHYSALNYQDVYFDTVLYQCCLISCAHISSLLAIKGHLHEHRTSTTIRIVIFSLFAIALCITIDLSEDAFQAFFVYAERVLIRDLHWTISTESWLVEYTSPAIVVVYLYWISIHPLMEGETRLLSLWQFLLRPFERFAKVLRNILQSLRDRRNRKTGEHETERHKTEENKTESGQTKPEVNESQHAGRSMRWIRACLRFIIVSHPAVALMIHLLFTGVSMAYLLLLKFAKARSPTEQEKLLGVGEWCSLWTPGNNAWSYGQWLPLFLLTTPILTSCMKFYGNRH